MESIEKWISFASRCLMLETTPCFVQVLVKMDRHGLEGTLCLQTKWSSGLKMGRVIFINSLPGMKYIGLVKYKEFTIWAVTLKSEYLCSVNILLQNVLRSVYNPNLNSRHKKTKWVFCIYLFTVCMCAHVCMHIYHCACVQATEQLMGICLLLPYVGSKDQTQVVRLPSKLSYLWDISWTLKELF